MTCKALSSLFSLGLICVTAGCGGGGNGSTTTTSPAATPTFMPVAGTYSSAQTVTISDSTPGATIYYTTNGTTPTSGSTVYNGPVLVSSTETLEAIATASGYSASSAASAAYTITPSSNLSITSLSPTSLAAGAASQTLTINGTGFLTTTTVTFNGVPHSASYLSSAQISITLTTADLVTAGIYMVVVTNSASGSSSSAGVSFSVSADNPIPTITLLTPASLAAGASSQTLTINGTGFLSTSTVTFNGVAHTPTYVSPSQLTISLTMADLATAGSYPVVVTNPAPSGGSSAPFSFTVAAANNPVPTISLLTPASLTVGAAPQTLTINGAGFVATSTATFNGATHVAVYISASELTISLAGGDLAIAGSYSVVVTNPAPGGGSSSAASFSVNNLLPSIVSITPSTVPEGSADTQVQITGSNFLPRSTVSANSVLVASTYVSATQLVATIPSGDLAIAGTVSISVTNPAPGGGTSPQSKLSVGSQSSDGPGVQQDGTADPESLVYFVGPPATSSSSGANSIQETNPTAGLKHSLSLASSLSAGMSPVDDPQHTCAEIGPDCVSGVPWAPQVQPAVGYNGPDGPGDWYHTANCGPASVLMVHSMLCSTKLDMFNELISLNDFFSRQANCPANSSCLFSSYAGQIDTNQIVDLSTGTATTETATTYNGRVVSKSSNFDACMADPTGEACKGGGPNISDLGQIAESYLGLKAQSNGLSLYSGSPSAQDCESPMAWLQYELDAGAPVIVHVDYKLGLDPSVGNAGHYMVVVGIDGTNCSNTVYVVDPGVNDPANGDYSNHTKICTRNGIVSSSCLSNVSSSAPCSGSTCRYTVGQFLQSWGRYNYGSLTLSGNSTACASPQTPVGIVASSISSLTAGQVGIPYSATIAANNGVQPYTWSIVSGQGTLPPAIQLDASSGAISGTPTSNGAFPFTVEVTDANNSVASGVATINIAAAASPLTITTPGELESATSGKAYSFPLSASGGVAPYHWSANGLICPNSISGLDEICVSDDGTIQGTPSTPTNGPVSFSLQVTDSSATAQKATKTESLAVLPANLPPQVYSVTANPSTVSELNTSTLACTAADPQQLSLSFSWSVTGGTVSGTGASVSWTAPSAPGGYSATCTVTSSAGLSASGSTVIQVSNSALNSGISPTMGTPATTQFTVNGSGATPSGGVTATITLPNTTTTTSHTTANSSGQYSFGPFTESATGVYSEIDSDDKTGGKSLPFSWTVTNSVAPVLSVAPTNAPVSAAAGSTNFSVSNSGTGTLSYSATVASGSSWLSIASGATGGNSGTINVSYSTNASAQRSGTIQVTATGASGSPATVTVTQAGVITSNTRISEDQGFDILLAPTTGEMDAWLGSSPYRDIGVYIGGCDASVAPPSGMKDGCGNVPTQVSARAKNSNLDSGWVSHVSNNGNGWGIMPLWVGPQSSCITSNPTDHNLIENAIQTTASALGASEADEAASRASELGMGNSIVYYDMEAYTAGNSSCSGNVGQFLSGWVNELHLKGFQVGVYVAASNVADFITPPDAIWVFRPNGNDVASDLGIAGSSNWSGKRIHQYCAGGSTQICPSPASLTYGGVTLGTSPNQGIDLDVEDGPVVSLSGAGPTSLSFTLTQTSFPTSTAPYTASIPATGSNFTNLNKVYLVWTGATSGNATWNKTDSDWTSKVSIASDTSMTLNPVVVAATDPAGTTNWTVTVYDSSGNSKSQNFSVTYK